jgi:AraC-like DNA-binding protein
MHIQSKELFKKEMKTIPIRKISPTPTEPKISYTLRIRKVEDVLGGKDMRQDIHRHTFFFVLALKKGKGNHLIDFTPHKVRNDSIFMMRPGQVHQLELKAGSTGYIMEFSMEFYHVHDRGTGNMLRTATTSNSCVLNEKSFDRLNSILASIFQEYTEEKDGHHEIIRAQLDIFFIEYVRNRKHVKASSSNVSLYEQQRLEEFLQLLETNLSSQKQISDYADMLNLSTYQLGAITKKALGKTPSELQNEFIILESKRCLLATSDQVNQIAWHLGYEDPSYFIRFFKKHTGFSPETFRSNST